MRARCQPAANLSASKRRSVTATDRLDVVASAAAAAAKRSALHVKNADFRLADCPARGQIAERRCAYHRNGLREAGEAAGAVFESTRDP